MDREKLIAELIGLARTIIRYLVIFYGLTIFAGLVSLGQKYVADSATKLPNIDYKAEATRRIAKTIANDKAKIAKMSDIQVVDYANKLLTGGK